MPEIGKEYYYIRNGQGDIIGLIDDTGKQVVSYSYNTWGKLIRLSGEAAESAGAVNPYRYRYGNERGDLIMITIESHDEPVTLNITTLIGAELDNANLSNADLSEASLIVAFVKNAILRSALLINARLIGTNFSNANLEKADLSGADIGGANFKGTKLFGAKMICNRIETAIFEGSYFDKLTEWPKGFDPISKGAILIE